MNTDLMLEKCGKFGRYQALLLGAFCFINVLSSMHYYSQTIISFVPEHWCYSNLTANMTLNDRRKYHMRFSNPSCTNIDEASKMMRGDGLLLEKNEYDKSLCRNGNISTECLMYSKKSTRQQKINGHQNSNNIDISNNNNNHKKCSRWIYDYDLLYGYQSMTSELNWVCENAWKSITGQSTYFIGSVIGTLVLGILADNIGRLPILIIAHTFGIIGNGLTIFATNEIAFALCRFISGMATDNNFYMMYILVLEYIDPKMRTFGLNLCIGIFYCFGSVITPWLAVWLGNWKLYLLATIIPTLIIPIFYFVIPESAEWLISKNRLEDALICYQKIAKFNRRKLSAHFIEDFKSTAITIAENLQTNGMKISKTENPTLISLFKTPRLRRLTLILFFKSMIITLGYDAISKNVENFGMSPFILFSLSASAILPACLVVMALQDRIGRKAMASSSLLISGMFTASCGIILAYQQPGNQKLNLLLIAILSIIGRFGITIAYNSGAQYATELIPTCVRGQGVAAAHVAGYALTFLSSYILYTATLFKAMPSLILGVLSFAGAFCCLFLPETLNRKTPVTLEEGEEFGRDERFFHFACFDKAEEEKNEH